MVAQLIPGLLGVGMQGVNALLSSRAQQDQFNLGLMQLYDARRNSRKQFQLATAARTDPQGNKVKYVPGQGWVYDLTDTTQQILDAQNKETLSQLREDAPRNRRRAERLAKRAEEATEELRKTEAGYRFRPRRSEGASQRDAIREIILARQQGRNATNDAIAKTLIRTGNTDQAKNIVNEQQKQEMEEFEKSILEGKRLGTQDYRAREAFDRDTFLADANYLAQVAGGDPGAGIQFTNPTGGIERTGGNAISDTLSAAAREGQTMGQAWSNLIRSSPSGIDLSGVARALGSLRFGGGKGETEEAAAGTQPGYIGVKPRPKPVTLDMGVPSNVPFPIPKPLYAGTEYDLDPIIRGARRSRGIF